jgi:hypothetical protein
MIYLSIGQTQKPLLTNRQRGFCYPRSSKEANIMTGCKALEGCEKKQDCLRYQVYRDSNGYHGWSAHQQCRVSAFTKKVYPFFIKREHKEK